MKTSRIFPYTENDTMDFGKYKHSRVKDLLEKDPEYLLWARDNVPFFKCTEELKRAISQAVLANENREED